MDAGNPEEGPLALPGEYTLKLSVDGQTFSAKLLLVADPRRTTEPQHRWILKQAVEMAPDDLKDIRKLLQKVGKLEFKLTNGLPIAPLIDAALAEQHRFIIQVRDDISGLATIVKQVRSVQTQLKERQALLKDDDAAKALLAENKKLTKSLEELEAKLHNPKAQVVYDILAQKGGAKLYSQYCTLYGFALDADGPPTQGLKEMYADLSKELKQHSGDWQKLRNGDMAKYNALSKKLEVPGVIVPKLKEEK